MDRNRVLSRVLYTLLRWTISSWLRWRFRIETVYDAESRDLRPPFIVLANHVNFWDPFLVLMPFRPPVHFIAADGNYRGHVMRPLMRFAGTIPKAKAKNDLESIRALQRYVAEGKVVGIFPEGQRSWDGTSRAVLPGTPKLVRLLRAPVVTVTLQGGYLSMPRWSDRLRRGVLRLAVTTVLTREEVRSLGKEEVTRRIAHSVAHDESRWQRETGTLFFDPRRAERVERALFHCPCCGGWDTLRSAGSVFRCTSCGEKRWIAPSGTLYRLAPDYPRFQRAHFTTVAEWNTDQLRCLREEIADPTNSAVLPYTVPAAHFLTGFRSRVLRPHGTVSIKLTRQVLRLLDVTFPSETLTGGPLPGEPPPDRAARTTPTPGIVEIPVGEITAIHVQYAHQLEFYHRSTLYVLRMIRPEDSAYRIEESVLAIQDSQTG